ncbi:sensor histidine kinase [Cecembia rubra]|uniref:histidine kinase n=1 Tax=Cecembia rubra TaxID=1485585 RepID=A0A2P8E4F2_9BACT|nr:ATP-binding protein [Cecembia rubra]PSL04340.1 phospho-acceptor domain-containing protein [Cecembia rubra]
MKEDLEEQIEKLKQLLLDKSELLDQSQKEVQLFKEQVIKNEKLASLGMLSAGIAHEIKNPLNFINNFSELSIEFLQEIEDILKGLEKTEAIEDIEAILNDLKYNLDKIQQNGQRVNRIVTSMLLQSRGNNGVFEPTDINQLIKEYVNLAFHGMRASKSPINVKIEFDLSEDIGLIPLKQEDFSRVILNLCNNAFDAMRENNNISQGGNREPVLKISTRKKDNIVIIAVEDNGQGISEDIKDKILQPFFTTKKGTQGTGLGLSISSDIVSAHQGTINIESKEGFFTKFIIKIPVS